MALSRSRRGGTGIDYWPGFVDALSTLVLGIVFMLTVFVVVQFFLAQEVTGKDTALSRLSARIAQLTDLLSLEQTSKVSLEDQLAQLRAGLASAEGERDRFKGLYEGLGGNTQGQISELTGKLDAEKQVSLRALAQVEVLNQQIAALRRQLGAIEQALEVSEKKDRESQTRIQDFAQRLNLALAQRAQELSRYRSDFFGRLRESSRHALHHVRERGYVERPARVDVILKALEVMPDVEHLRPRNFGESPIRAVHDVDFVNYLRNFCLDLPDGELVYPYVFPIRRTDRPPRDMSMRAGYYCIDTFTPLSRDAYKAARAAVNVALSGAEAIVQGNQLVYSLCRPPGHHAERDSYGGFCYFCNGAIAAQYLLPTFGRVAILDVDYHHGNGTQDIFFDRADVLTVSIHGHPKIAYPYFSGFVDEVGEGAGKGFNHNFPLPEEVDDRRYLEALDDALGVVRKFKPEVLVVSLGLDIAKADPTGTWTITPDALFEIGNRIGGLRLPTLLVQEGGYNIRSLGRNAARMLTGVCAGALGRRTRRKRRIKG